MIFSSKYQIDIPEVDLLSYIFDISPDGSQPTSSDKPVYVNAHDPTQRMNRAELEHKIKSVAAGLRHVFKIRDGDVVLAYCENSILYPAVILGSIASGAIFTGANPGYTYAELTNQLTISGAKCIFTDIARLEMARKAAKAVGLPSTSLILIDSEDETTVDGVLPFQSLLKHGTYSWERITDPKVLSDKTAVLNFSSGTTGLPKACEMTHRNLVANAEQSVHLDRVARMRKNDPTFATNDVHCAFLPFYHAMGLITFCLNNVKKGCTTVVMPRFDMKSFLGVIQDFKLTYLIFAPPVVSMFVKTPLVSQYDLSSVKFLTCGAAPLQADLEKRLESHFTKTGARCRQGWGMSEATMAVSLYRPDEEPVSGSVGYLVPNMQLKIVDEDGKELGYDEEGEALLRGPNMFKGYYKNPTATKDSVTYDGWVKTGDIIKIDKTSLITIVDRKKELIKVKGYQVAPSELEGHLLEHEGVLDCAVIRVLRDGQEHPQAHIVRKKPDVTAESILAFMDKRLSPIKRITGGVIFTDVIPKSRSGKILRRLIKDGCKDPSPRLSEPSPGSPSMCFQELEGSINVECNSSITQDPPWNKDESHALETDSGAQEVHTNPRLRYNAGPSARSHVLYSYYSFLVLDMSGLEPDDVHYLESRSCLSVPAPDALDDFVREYFLHVHPGLPLLDEAIFWSIYSGDQEPQCESTISLFLLQAMLFASCSCQFVPFSTLKSLGFTSRRNAREKYYRRAKVSRLTHKSGLGKDHVSNAQGALLLSYYAISQDRARNNSILLATAIHLAQDAGADQFHKRSDPKSPLTNKLKRLWWCCIVRDRILPLGVRRQLQITSIDLNHGHLTEQDFEQEIQESQVYSTQNKRNLIQLFTSLCELAIPFTSVIQTVYGTGQSGIDTISPIIQNQQKISESIRLCEISLDAWFDKAAIQFPTPAGIISSEKSLVLYTNLMYIYYYSARVALYQYEAFVISLASPGVGLYDRLHQIRGQLEDAQLGITDNLKELVQLKVARFLPVSIAAYAALPLVLHILDVKLAKLPSQTARKQGRLNIYMETMKGLHNLYDGIDDIWACIRGAMDYAISGTRDTSSQQPSLNLDNALCSRSTDALLAIDDWGNFLLREPILYFRLSRTLDLSLAAGHYSEDSSLTVLLRSARLPSPSLVFIEGDGYGHAAESQVLESERTCVDEKVMSELGDNHFELTTQIFNEIGDLDGYDFGMDCLEASQPFDAFELNLVDIETDETSTEV
ncbi:cutinase transcription factor 1 beta [Fusarium beomiforme]|uniref:Cutinase transcription factor 1 beta n=1 Tax=Fusarium beomiforme TaxID=44412 RepID=A0A9P5AHW0_9HYPO|nr:cutinase transcription factor 1 beta [Fusarium beomiforme]